MSLVPYSKPSTSLAELQDVAKAFAASGYFKDATDVAKAYTKVLAGNELGIPPMQAMTGIHIVEGKPTLSGPLVGALIKRSGRYDYRVKVLTDTECVLTFMQDGEPVGESGFTIADAQKAGLAGKGVWQKYPRNMLLARALTNGARWYCPDVFGGAVYTPEEMGAQVDEDGAVVLPAIESAAPVNDATPTQSGASPEGNDGVTGAAVDVEALEIAPPEQIEAFWGLVEKVAAADPAGKTVGYWRSLADKAAEREFTRPIAHLTSDELARIATNLQTLYAKYKGSGGETPGPPSPDEVTPSGDGSLAPPEQTSAGEQPSGDGPSASVEATDAPAEPLFKAPEGPRGSKARKHKDAA